MLSLQNIRGLEHLPPESDDLSLVLGTHGETEDSTSLSLPGCLQNNLSKVGLSPKCTSCVLNE